MAIPKLTYFDIRGRGEPIRLAFVVGGIEFIDERLSFAQFQEQKESFPFGTAPMVEIDGIVIGQSIPALNYVGRQAGIYPENDPKTAVKIEEIQAYIYDVNTQIGQTMRESDPDKKMEIRTQLAVKYLPAAFGRIEAILAKNGTGYCVGESLTTADLLLVALAHWIESGILDGIPKTILSEFEMVQKCKSLVYSHPKIKEWYEK
uniref:Glutathione S-transferase n=1 Tax=Compsopogon caeruleus TaxID=31354 RepID=A0A7S1XCV9_9RHOD|mmetsp:Transcript_15923/g.31992  ORF Transcript_15923/g.31992 Transcript_15923/m.31992 type:complete len:204 (+) Transcript_15923:74-685(+)